MRLTPQGTDKGIKVIPFFMNLGEKYYTRKCLGKYFHANIFWRKILCPENVKVHTFFLFDIIVSHNCIIFIFIS